uniref:Uncharacterized protein n=1 Tax=Lygus hesperus TaxID=30085 RepID=A0A146MFI6_LYGHE
MELEKPVSGTEGGGVGGYGLPRIPPGPGQAAQQDPKSQPQQSLQPGSMPLSYQPNPRGGQPQYYQARPQQRLQNNAPRMGPGMQGTAVFAALPSSNMFQQTSLVSGQVPTSILIPPVQYHMAARHHPQASGQGGTNQQQNYFQLPGYMAAPQMTGPPPFSNYGPVYMQQPIRSQFQTPNSTQNQVPQQQPAPQQSSVQQLYVEQVGGGGPQVTMPSMSGGPGGPNGTPHIMGPQAPNSISLVQNPGAIPSGAAMMPNPQASKKIRKFAIPIIDPDSGQNVLLDEDKEGVSHSADSSASHTPQPQVSKEHDDIKAKLVVGEFAFKVAAVAFVPEPPSNAAASAATPSAPPHIEERLNGPVDHSHENELVKEPSPAPLTVASPQQSAPQMSAQQQQQQHPTLKSAAYLGIFCQFINQ